MKISLTDDIQSCVFKLSEGNPGALNVLIQGIKEGADIDPDNFMGPCGLLLHLDDLGIYGSRIWILYKDLCNQSIVRVIGLCRAVQLGFLSRSDLNDAIDGKIEIDTYALLKKVRERLPNFRQTD